MNKSRRGLMLATAAAAFFASQGTVLAPVQAEEAMIHCGGVNACKGMSDCKTADNACKGQNACKGHGFKATTSADCTAQGGTAM
ncbi:MAG: BufA2 family periplasmic bufferin-type metallophore [Gammaproteobacteria bacterium]